MNDNDISWKIIKIIIPFLAYYIVTLVIQAVAGIVAVNNAIREQNGNAYELSYTLMDKMESAVNTNGLLVTLIIAIIMIPIMIYLMYIDRLYEKIKPFNPSGYGLVVILGITAALGAGSFFKLLPLDGIIGSYEHSQQMINNSPISLQLLSVVFIVPIMEELMFRGVIYNRLKVFGDKLVAVYVSAILFGIYHMNLAQGLYAFTIGVLLAMVYEYFESIIAPMVMHICANLCAFIMSHNGLSRYIDNHLGAEIIATVLELCIFIGIIVYFINIYGNNQNRKFVRVIKRRNGEKLDYRIGNTIEHIEHMENMSSAENIKHAEDIEHLEEMEKRNEH